MAEYNLGTAKGEIKVTYDGQGVDQANKSLKDVQKNTISTKEAMDKTAVASAAAGGLIAGGLALASKSAMDFEKQLSAIGAVSGANESQLEMLRKKALQLGADTSFSASQAAMAMEELVKAGLSVDDVMNGAADATVALAAAGGVELPEAATIASNAMNQFGLAAKDLPNVADKIAGAANASAIDVRDFGFSLSQVGAVAHLAGQSFDDTAAAIALMGNAGIKGSDAGTSLKTFLSNLIPTTEKATGVMEDLGIITTDGANRFLDAQGNYKGMAEIAEILHQSMKGLSEAQQQVALETIFGSDAIRAAAVISKEGAGGFNEMAAAMGKVTAEDVAAKRLDNTAGAIEQLKGSAETAAIAIGTILLPIIKELAKILTSAANWFSGLDSGVQKTITIMGVVVATVLLVVAAIVKIIQIVKMFQAVWIALNISFTVTPIGAIIAAIVVLIGIIVLIATKTDWFQKLWDVIWNAIKTAFTAVVDFITGYFKFMFNLWLTIWTAIWNGVKAVFVAIWDFLVGAVKFYINTIVTIIKTVVRVYEMIRDFFTRARDAAVDRLKDLVDTVKSIPGKILDAIKNLGSLLFNAGKNLITGLINGILDSIPGLRNAFNTITGLIPDWKGPEQRDKKLLTPSGEWIMEGLSRGIANMVPALRSQLGDITDLIARPGMVSAAVVGAGGGSASVPMAEPQIQSSRTVTINNLNLSGVWDFADPGAARKIVGKLHDALDRYEKDYR